MSRSQNLTENERQAELIIRRWIHKKTGVSDFERALWKAGQALQRMGAAINKALAPMPDYTHTKERTGYYPEELYEDQVITPEDMEQP